MNPHLQSPLSFKSHYWTLSHFYFIFIFDEYVYILLLSWVNFEKCRNIFVPFYYYSKSRLSSGLRCQTQVLVLLKERRFKYHPWLVHSRLIFYWPFKPILFLVYFRLLGVNPIMVSWLYSGKCLNIFFPFFLPKVEVAERSKYPNSSYNSRERAWV